MAPTDALVQRLGEIHHTVHNNGQRTLECILKTCSEMFCDRGAVRTTTGQDDSGFVVHGWDQNDEESMRVHLCTEDRIGVRLARTLLEAADGLPLVLVSIERVASPTRPTPPTHRQSAVQPGPRTLAVHTRGRQCRAVLQLASGNHCEDRSGLWGERTRPLLPRRGTKLKDGKKNSVVFKKHHTPCMYFPSRFSSFCSYLPSRPTIRRCRRGKSHSSRPREASPCFSWRIPRGC
jgi:hypothetical protein